MHALRQSSPVDWTAAQAALREWYASEAAGRLHARVAARIEGLLRDRYALHCLQLGGTRAGIDLLCGRALIHRMHVTGDGADSLRALPEALPLASGSVDFVLLCHALEFSPDPHALLREVDRVLTLDGQVLCVGFNPWSLLGMRGWCGGAHPPWCGHFYGPGRIGDWFALLGWRIQRRETVGLIPPVRRAAVRRRLERVEALQPWLPGQGSVYLLLGRKHSIPFQPLPLRHAQADRKPVVGGLVRPTHCTKERS